MPIVHEDAIKMNTDTIFTIARSHNKKLRVATKSLRVPDLIDLVTSSGHHEPMLMCYSVKEADFLIQWSQQKYKTNKFTDIMIAYPTANRRDLELALKLNKAGHKVVTMVDCLEHLLLIEEMMLKHSDEERKTPFPVCIDVDASLRFLNGLIHLGAHRSPCHSAETFEILLSKISSSKGLIKLSGVMTYEAQIAGVGDSSIHNSFLFNWAIRLMKRFSRSHVTKLRQQVSLVLQQHGVEIDFFNGGGTGNLEEAAFDPNLTEITAGSGFLQPELFDYYLDNMCSPALAIALQVTRIQKSTSIDLGKDQMKQVSEVICCQSGGFIASGSVGNDKTPSIFLPRGLDTFTDEGFGEVQTPLKVSKQLQLAGLAPRLGDYVLIRPAKSGEIAERFPKYLMVNSETTPSQIQVLTTYRGHGVAFF